MDPTVSGIIGGAVGSVLTGLVRALGIPSEARAHDAAIGDRDDQLATWVADRDHALRRECTARRASLGQPPPDGPDAYGNHPRNDWLYRAAVIDGEIADARALALHQYRDQERQARLDVARILAAEGWPHRWWRRLARQKAPALATPEQATPVLDSWRRPSGMNPERHTFPDDATKRTLADAISSVTATGP